MPTVSVVIPTYNRASYLEQALESVLGQTYTDLEVIVVDDGSTDSTCSVVQNMDDSRITYLYQKNAGRSVARNYGMSVARGDYLAFLDDDDLYLSNKLEAQVAFLRGHPDIDLVASGALMINAQGVALAQLRLWEEQPDLTLLSCLYGCPLLSCTVLFRRKFLDRLDHWFDPALVLAEDKDFFVRMLLAGGHFAWLREIHACYRWHEGNSQQNGALYSVANQQLLSKLFLRDDLPPEVRSHQSQLKAHYYLVGACFSYATGQVEAAQTDLENALILQHEIGEGAFPVKFAETVASFADSPRINDSLAYIDFVFDHLPRSLSRLQRCRRQAFSILHMKRVFAARSQYCNPTLRDWFLGVFYAPNWLLNRGIWSILLRDIVHLLPRKAS